MSVAAPFRVSGPSGAGRLPWAFLASAMINALCVVGLTVLVTPRYAEHASDSLAVGLITTPLPETASPAAPASPGVLTPSSARRSGARRGTDPVSAAELAPGTSVAGLVPPGPSAAVGEVPAGLRSLLAIDPCADTLERLKKDCRLKWAGAMAPGGGVAPEVLEEIAEAFPGFKSDGVFCSLHLGCGAAAQVLNLNGTRPVDRVSPMASGAGGLGGPHDLVGRLPPPNPYHVDPGFGD